MKLPSTLSEVHASEKRSKVKGQPDLGGAYYPDSFQRVSFQLNRLTFDLHIETGGKNGSGM